MAKKNRKKNKEPRYGRAAREGEGSAAPPEADGKKDEEKASEKEGWVEGLKSVGIAVVLFVLLRAFILQTFVITSGSMENTLLVGDFLMVNRVSIGSRVPFTQFRLPGFSEVRRGDVLVFDPHHDPELKLVKRLVGLAGDTLQMIDGELIRNGEKLVEPYVRHEDPVGDQFDPMMGWQRDHLVSTVDRAEYRPTRDDWGPIVVPEEHYFMLGDNRDTSLDSRYWGPLASWRLEGRVVFKYFSYERGSTVPFAWLRRIRWERIFSGIS